MFNAKKHRYLQRWRFLWWLRATKNGDNTFSSDMWLWVGIGTRTASKALDRYTIFYIWLVPLVCTVWPVTSKFQ